MKPDNRTDADMWNEADPDTDASRVKPDAKPTDPATRAATASQVSVQLPYTTWNAICRALKTSPEAGNYIVNAGRFYIESAVRRAGHEAIS